MDVVVYDMFLTCTRRLEPTSVGSLRLQTLRSTIHVYFLSRVLLSGSLCISILRTDSVIKATHDVFAIKYLTLLHYPSKRNAKKGHTTSYGH